MTTTNCDSSMETFRNDQYTITTSLSEHHIIAKLVNNVSYASYEGTFDKSAFKLPFGLPTLFKLLNKCFTEFVAPTGSQSDYTVDIQLCKQSEYITMDCHCVVDGFLNVDFTLRLKEQHTAERGETTLLLELNRQKQVVKSLTEQMTRMERVIKQDMADITIKQNRVIDGLVKRLSEMEETIVLQKKEYEDKLSALESVFGYAAIGIGYHYYPINTSHITINNNDLKSNFRETVCRLYQLNEITFEHCNEEINFNYVKKITTVKKLNFNNCYFRWVVMPLGACAFPNLTELNFISCYGDISSNVLTNCNHLKLITITDHHNGAIHGLQTYCEQNGIELIIL